MHILGLQTGEISGHLASMSTGNTATALNILPTPNVSDMIGAVIGMELPEVLPGQELTINQTSGTTPVLGRRMLEQTVTVGDQAFTTVLKGRRLRRISDIAHTLSINY